MNGRVRNSGRFLGDVARRKRARKKRAVDYSVGYSISRVYSYAEIDTVKYHAYA